MTGPRRLDRLRRVRPPGTPRGPMAAAWVPFVLIAMVVAATVAGLSVRPAEPQRHGDADYVIVAGAAGLRWEDLDPQRTPALWQEATEGSVGWLSVRSGHEVTCPSDGWLTLGAGNYAAWDTRAVPGRCPAAEPRLTQPDGIGANLTDQPNVVRTNQNKLPYGTTPGALAESVRCSVAVGPGAAIAAARPFGRVDRYVPELPEDPAKLLGDCVLNFVDLGTITGEGAEREAAVAAADRTLARVLAARPPRSLMLIAGLADTATTSRLHVAIAEGPGWEGGWLTSAGTGREGYLQLVDLAPTVLSALGRPAPEKLFAGYAATVLPGRPGDPGEAMQGDRDADRRAIAQRGVAEIFFTVLAIVQLLLFAAVIPVLIRARRHAGPLGPPLPPRRLVVLAELALIAAGLAIPAALLADVVPWWGSEHPAWMFGSATAVLMAGGTLLIRLAPRYERTLWPMAAVAAVSVLVVAVDLITGSRLQLNGVAGYSAIHGIRYAGLGSVGLGVFVAGLLLLAGSLAQWVSRRWRPLVVVTFGGLGVVMVGSPYLGADPVGAIAVTAGVCVAAAISTGGWLTFPRFAWAAMTGVAVTITFAVLDLSRAPLEQGTLGRFLTALGDGTAGPAMQRAAAANGLALLDSPLSLLALFGAAMLVFCQFSPWGGLNRVYGLHPAVRAGVAGTVVATLIAGVLGGTALGVAGAAAAAAVPVAVLTALRVLLHAADRTPPPGETDGPGGPLLRKSDDDSVRVP
ncbi:hypothetical protein FHR83_003894 [Actinoplanes campanulatus]|uniref:Uncharacterized protein n=2 Tax=Actinoplanes campanulatus TaxID=113559 RepID=A0A7W5AI85_9ACTN|nr:hypothetical protein [Actinoplanes campanulatus]MBB3096224.1 hypothetical protein [Actinoplanes campanulatus]GGN51094.1 hypothetical protein GCM10010109_90930 [Actinoplanes campanulatus]GID42538.1 hypothetical protein Aca09nite_90440 [Actinoplanes campanulatus]